MIENPNPCISRRASIFLALASFFVGLFAGGGSVYAYWENLTNQLCLSAVKAQTQNAVGDLNWLRAGKTTNVVDLLEVNLDGDLIGLVGFLHNPHELRGDVVSVKILQMAKEYRTRFPHKSGSSQVDEAVANAFHLLDGQDEHQPP
jgi:hypothetical protein